MTQEIRLNLLGYPQIYINNEPVNLASHKTLALFVYLVVTGQPAARDKLTGLFWGNVSEDKAKTSLRSTLYNIQQQLPTVLNVTRKHITLADNFKMKVDIHEFEEMLMANNLDIRQIDAQNFQAEFMDGFYVADAPEFDHWLLFERNRLHQLAVTYLETAFKTSEAENILLVAQYLLQLEPWREEIYEFIIRHYARQQEYLTALKYYQRYHAYMRREFDLEPSNHLQKLINRVQTLRNKPISNLPPQPVLLFGRDTDVSNIKGLLHTSQIVTLVGMGGMGKTQLAMRVGQELLGDFMDGVWLLPLVTIEQGTNLPRVLAQILGISGVSTQSLRDYLISILQDYECLLIFDNIEHLLPSHDILTFLQDLVTHCPHVKVLITSRDRLNFSTGHIYELHGLPQIQSMVDLFIAIAQRVNPQFALNEETRELIQTFGKYVDGMPLAIEIAASTMHWQTLPMLWHDVQEDITNLATNLVDVPARHQNLYTVLTQSWQQLRDSEQYILYHLAVIRGDFELAAAQAIGQATAQELAGLVNKSLLRFQESRYSLHEIVRQYVRQTTPASLDNTIYERHRDYFFTLFKNEVPNFKNSKFKQAFQKLTPQLDNFLAACQWTIGQKQYSSITHDLLEAIENMFVDRGYNQQYLQLAEDLVHFLEEGPMKIDYSLYAHAQLLYLYCLYWYTSDHDLFKQKIDVLEAELRQVNLLPQLCVCITLQGWYFQYNHQDFIAAEEAFQEAYQLSLEAGDRYESNRRLNDLGLVTQHHHPEQAREYWQEGLHQANLFDDVRLATVILCNLGALDLQEGLYETAEGRFKEALVNKTEHYGVLLSAYKNLAAIYLHQEELGLAYEMAQKAVAAAQIRQQKGDLVQSYYQLAEVLIQQNRVRAAQQELNQALQIAHVEQDQAAIAQVQARLAEIERS